MVTQTQVLPLYTQCFQNPFCDNLKQLNSPNSHFITPLSARVADFSIQDKAQGWRQTAQQILALSLKVVLFPWGFYELTKYIVQRLVMLPLYPAQSFILKKWVLSDLMGTAALDEIRIFAARELKNEGFVVRHVALEKNGTRYSGLLIGHESTIRNRQWALQATGNLEFIEHSALDVAALYKEMSFNTLLINGPGVGRSEGEATPESMGEAQELGLRFLETAIHAEKIVIAGRSLGGAAVGQAILQHEFKEDISYLVVRQMTFDRVSTICSKTVAEIFPRLEELVRKLVIWAGCEIDSVAASRKLQHLGIKEVIVQCTNRIISPEWPAAIGDFETDGPILSEASLGLVLIREHLVENKVFLGLPFAQHMTNEAVLAPWEEIEALSV